MLASLSTFRSQVNQTFPSSKVKLSAYKEGNIAVIVKVFDFTKRFNIISKTKFS